MAPILALLILVAAVPTDDPRLAQGIQLHDAGDYDGAIRIYRAILDDHPNDKRAQYELVYSTYTKGDYTAVIKLGEETLARDESALPDLYVLLGNTYDIVDRVDTAEEMFRRGLRQYPQFSPLYFNLGVTQAIAGKLDAAAQSFLDGLRRRPDHSSGWLQLAEVSQRRGRPASAIAALARFLSLEPDSERAARAAQVIWNLLLKNVKAQRGTAGTPSADDGKVKIDITLPTIEGDDEAAQQTAFVAIAGATRYLEQWQDKSDAAFFVDGLRSILAMLSEREDADGGFWKVCALAYFEDAQKAGHWDALAYEIRRAAADADAARWREEHGEAVAAYRAWGKAWQPARACGDGLAL